MSKREREGNNVYPGGLDEKRARIEAVEEYKQGLLELTGCAKPVITSLTEIAEENKMYAPQIAEAINRRIMQLDPDLRTPPIYLMDSIVKNVRNPYADIFTQFADNIFIDTYSRAKNPETHRVLNHLVSTWQGVFPASVLSNISRYLAYRQNPQLVPNVPGWMVVPAQSLVYPVQPQPRPMPPAQDPRLHFQPQPQPQPQPVFQPQPQPQPQPMFQPQLQPQPVFAPQPQPYAQPQSQPQGMFQPQPQPMPSQSEQIIPKLPSGPEPPMYSQRTVPSGQNTVMRSASPTGYYRSNSPTQMANDRSAMEVTKLYNSLGIQCPECGLRFIDKKEFNVHFLQHDRERKRRQSANQWSRGWFSSNQNWVKQNSKFLEVSTMMLLNRPNNPPPQTKRTVIDKSQVQARRVYRSADPSQAKCCCICGETFESEYDQVEEEWVLKDALLLADGRCAHEHCTH